MSDKRYSIYVLGCQASGKSSFLAGLGIVSEPDRSGSIPFVANESDRGPVHLLANTLRDGNWPASTVESCFINGILRFNNHDIPVRWLDYSGERFVQYFNEGGSQFGEIPEELLEADYYLLALDPEVDLAGNQAFETPEDKKGYKTRLHALITAVSDFRLKRGNQRPLRIAALITKADKIDGKLVQPQEAEKYLRENAPNLLKTLRNQFPDMPVLAVSAVGHTEQDGKKPGPDLEPWGYESIFEWIINDVNKQRRHRTLKRLLPCFIGGIVILLAVVGWHRWGEFSAQEEIKQLAPRVQSEEDRDKMTTLLQQTSEDNRKSAIDNLIDQVGGTLDNPSAQVSDYEDALKKLEPVVAGGDGYRIQEVDALRVRLRESIEDSKFHALELAFKNNDAAFAAMALEYLGSFPTGRYRDEVGEYVKQRQQTVLEQDISKIETMGASNIEGLRNIGQSLREFVTNHPDKAPQEMRDAARHAIRLADEVEKGELAVELKYLGTIAEKTDDEAWFHFTVSLGKKDSEMEVYNQTSQNKVRTYSFEGQKEFKIPWRPGDKIILEARLDWGRADPESVIGSKELLGLLAIAELDGEVVLDKQHDDVEYFDNERVVLTADVQGWEPTDWQLLKSWVIDKTALSALGEQ